MKYMIMSHHLNLGQNHANDSHCMLFYDKQCLDPLFLSNNQEASCPERHEHDGRSEVVYHLTAELFPQGHDTEQHSPS